MWRVASEARVSSWPPIEDGPSQRADHKTTPKWAWPGSRDPVSKFGTPYNF